MRVLPLGDWLPTGLIQPSDTTLVLNWAVRVQELDLIPGVSRFLFLLCQEIINISWSTHSFTLTKPKETDKNLIMTMNIYTVKHDNQVDWIPMLPTCLFSPCEHIHIGSLILIRFLSELGCKGMVFVLCVLLGKGQSGRAAKGNLEEAQRKQFILFTHPKEDSERLKGPHIHI